MFDSRSELGSVVLDVRGRQLDVVALDANGVVRDHFTMVKGSPTPPTADFSGTPTDGVAPLSVQFSDLSTNTPTMWEWDFQNDGSVDASSAGPSHVFTAPGLYGVRLEARNGFGSNAAVRDAYVCVRSANGVSDVDQDGMPDGTDRCPCLADPEQMDTDGDGAGNACDADDDGDGVPDTGDCAPLDSGVGTLPSDVGDTLRPGASSDQLVWDPNVAAFAWNVYRGVVDSGAPFSYGHLCHEGESPDPETKDSEAPQSGAWFYYLVGAWNACGEGTLGAASDGTPRPSTSVCR
jgi:PKD repeat protein